MKRVNGKEQKRVQGLQQEVLIAHKLIGLAEVTTQMKRCYSKRESPVFTAGRSHTNM